MGADRHVHPEPTGKNLFEVDLSLNIPEVDGVRWTIWDLADDSKPVLVSGHWEDDMPKGEQVWTEYDKNSWEPLNNYTCAPEAM